MTRLLACLLAWVFLALPVAAETVTSTSPAVTIASGADVTLGSTTDAKSTATDGTSITIEQVLKEISFMAQTPAALPANQSVNVAQVNGSVPSVSLPANGGGLLASGINVNAQMQVYSPVTGTDKLLSITAGLNSDGRGTIGAGLVGQLDDVSPTAVTENNFGPVRMSADRALLTSSHPYTSDQTPETATSGNVANATAAATLATAAGKTTYITGFSCESGGATAAADVDITVTGVITATMHFAFDTGGLNTGHDISRQFNPPIPASATNTTVVVSMPANGTGNTNATCNAEGFQQ